MVSDDEEDESYIYALPNPNIPHVLIQMTYKLWDVVMDNLDPLILNFQNLHQLNYILQWSFGNDKVAMRDAFLRHQEAIFEDEEVISEEDQIWTDELLENLDDALAVIHR